MNTPVQSRLRFRRFTQLAAVVLLHAVVQAVLVAGDPVPTASLQFVVEVLASAAALVLALAMAATLTRSGVVQHDAGRRRWATAARLLSWAAGVVLATAAGAVVFPALGALPILVAVVLLPAAAATPRATLRTAAVSVRAAPLRGLGLAALTLLLLALGAVAALLLGFFVTGWLAALVTWLWFGVVGAVLLRLGARLVSRRPSEARTLAATL